MRRGAMLIVVGVCMTGDTIEPAYLIQKQIAMRFVFAYDPGEFAEATRMLAKDPARVAPLGSRRVAEGRAFLAKDCDNIFNESLHERRFRTNLKAGNIQ
jgi:hypothetical protein